ncbi:hypothetical protein [Polaromonas sp.]|uniref:hypothetical protein n=1 Tax=Polaromonas sp. TaxID=1869339 RepID=UPI003751618E
MSSRLVIDPETQLPSIQSFGELKHFLRSAMADEESLQLADGMGGLSVSIEAVLTRLKPPAGLAEASTQLIDLMTTLREHRALVIDLSPAWRGLYEYASYLAALNNLRVLIGQWLLPPDGVSQGDAATARAIGLEDFELIAWRTLGEGMLLIDMHEQLRAQMPVDSAPATLDASRLERARSWWGRLRK